MKKGGDDGVDPEFLVVGRDSIGQWRCRTIDQKDESKRSRFGQRMCSSPTQILYLSWYNTGTNFGRWRKVTWPLFQVERSSPDDSRCPRGKGRREGGSETLSLRGERRLGSSPSPKGRISWVEDVKGEGPSRKGTERRPVETVQVCSVPRGPVKTNRGAIVKSVKHW